MELSAKPIGKRFLHQHEEEMEHHLHKKSPRSASPGRNTNEDQKEQMSQSLQSLPEEVVCTICSYLNVHTLLDMRCVNRFFRTLASKNSAGWSNLCDDLWKNKIHVSPAARSMVDSKMTAYRISLQDAQERHHIERHELLFDPDTKTGTIWSFRFKEAAGTDWTSWDPWYRGQPCRKMVFLQDGSVKEYQQSNRRLPPPPPPQDQEDQEIAMDHHNHHHHDHHDADASLEDPSFSHRIQLVGNMTDPPIPMVWRFVTRPLDMPERPEGSYVRFSVAGRDVPTYCVRRSPTNNWGFIMESCWGVYASFELPKRMVHSLRRRHLRLRRAQDADGNWFNVAIEASDDEEEEEEDDDDDENDMEDRRRSRLLVDDRSFTITSELQWREALMYNYGARNLPEGEEALSDFELIYAMLNT
jgi:hypothetical protein